MDSYFRTYSQLHTNTCVGHLTTGQGLPAMLTSIVVEAHACDDPHDSYDLLFGAASRLYRARTSSGFTENHPVIAATINTVVSCVYELDELCGGATTYREDMLLALDGDMQKFTRYLSARLRETSSKSAVQFILFFAELVYVFNGYQAPVRATPQEAVRDAAGLSDPFNELTMALLSTMPEKTQA